MAKPTKEQQFQIKSASEEGRYEPSKPTAKQIRQGQSRRTIEKIHEARELGLTPDDLF